MARHFGAYGLGFATICIFSWFSERLDMASALDSGIEKPFGVLVLVPVRSVHHHRQHQS